MRNNQKITLKKLSQDNHTSFLFKTFFLHKKAKCDKIINCLGLSPSGKATDSDSVIRRFESF